MNAQTDVRNGGSFILLLCGAKEIHDQLSIRLVIYPGLLALPQAASNSYKARNSKSPNLPFTTQHRSLEGARDAPEAAPGALGQICPSPAP